MLRFVFILFMSIISINAQYSSFDTYAIPVFENLPGNQDYAWLSEAIPDMLTTDLTATKKVRVVGRRELKKVIAEQKLSLSGLVNANDQIELGQILGASRLIVGSFTIIGNEVRIDTKVLNSMNGEVVFATKSKGPLTAVFQLEKILTIKLLENLGVTLSDNEKIELFQIESSNLQAVSNNYQGVIQLDAKNPMAAKAYFNKAVEQDPYYRNAGDNLKKTASFQVSGKALFAGISNEIDKKDQQLASFKQIVEEFTDNIWVVNIDGKPGHQTNSSNPNMADLTIPVHISLNHEAIKKYINDSKRISAGEIMVRYRAKELFYNDPSFYLFAETYKWYINNPNIHSKYYHKYFRDIYSIILYDNESIIAEQKIDLSFMVVSGRLLDFLESDIRCNNNNINDSIQINFEGLPLEQISRITRIEIE